MRIAVLVKHVPDSWAQKRLDDSGRLDRASVDCLLNDLDEYAVEAALELQRELGAEVTVVTMGPAAAADAIRRALAMGADAGVHVTDERLVGSDLHSTVTVLAKAITHGAYDLVFTGVETTDARGGVVAAMLAELLGWPGLTYTNGVEVADGTVSGERVTATRRVQMSAKLPAVVSVVEKANSPRYPSMKGILAAKKKPVAVVGLDELGLTAADVAPKTRMLSWEAMPARSKGRLIAPEQLDELVDFLRERKAI